MFLNVINKENWKLSKTIFFVGGNNGEKTYFQVTVVYHVCRNFRSIIAKHPWERIAQAKLEMFTTYNCRYIKEFISGVDSHWIMNGINVYKMEEDPIYQKNA